MQTKIWNHFKSEGRGFGYSTTRLSPPQPPVIYYLPFQGGKFVVIPYVTCIFLSVYIWSTAILSREITADPFASCLVLFCNLK